jgi:cytochrome c553
MQNRRDERMSPAAAKITKTKDLLDISAYFAAQRKMSGKPGKSPALALGRSIYENGLPKRGLEPCADCHGVTGKGNAVQNPTFPMIGGQHKQYILNQLSEFRYNKRTTDPTGIMSNVGRILSAQELDAVAEYVSSL